MKIHSFLIKEFRNAIKIAINEKITLKKKIKDKKFAEKIAKNGETLTCKKILISRVNKK